MVVQVISSCTVHRLIKHMNDKSIETVLRQIRCKHFDVAKISVNDDGLLCCLRCEKVLTSDEVMLRYKETFGETAEYEFQLLVLFELSMRNRKKYEQRKKEIDEKKLRIRKHIDDYYNKLRSKGSNN